ncbi:MAG: MGH1-like glycoside hydrolase domain-containing protein [Pyrinomonadaceae bacterium]
MNAEQLRLDQAVNREKDWKLWGPYISDRAWGTVREDYSADGSAWDYFPFEQAHLKAFRWNEDGIAGICDRHQNVCLALALWNENDEILKERFFGVNGNQGNHGEDVKEYYFYTDNVPTHSYMKMLYKYPHQKFPYDLLKNENIKRDKTQPEFELLDTGIFDENKYFDVFIEYAKAAEDDLCIKITAVNRGSEKARLQLLPTIWFRNTWFWSETQENLKPKLQIANIDKKDVSAIRLNKEETGVYWLLCESTPELLFTDNETNYQKLYQTENKSEFTKDGINDYLVNGNKSSVNRENKGTKAAALYTFDLESNQSKSVYLRLCSQATVEKGLHFTDRTDFIAGCEDVFEQRKAEADEFYKTVTPTDLNADAKNIMRQSLAGMLWSKQYYHYIVKEWLEGDPAFPPPPKERLKGRNHQWKHLYNDEIISMPDKWEYPWYAAWDSAFHCIPLAMVDPEFAKRQLLLLLREWYMHPNGQIPAYEWAFGDVNPPVHAWAALRVYKIEARMRGVADRIFLEKVFHKLLLNFTWWVNRKDVEGNNVFEGGFLGLDNIGIFDRSAKLPSDGHIEQSDGTSWMAMYCLNMLGIALELAKEDMAYEDVASKFFEHFVYISDAMNNLGEAETELWCEEDGFYYDVLHFPQRRNIPLKIRSMVGLIPLFAVETLEDKWLDDLPNFKKRTEWFLKNRPDLTAEIACLQEQGREGRRILAIVNKNRLRRILEYLLDETEFLSDYGIRALSRYHKDNPYSLELDNNNYRVAYEPGESRSGMFGGNSNWRGPIWFPMNFLLIESLQKFDYFFGNDFKVEMPTGSGNFMNLWQVSQEIEKRLSKIFLRDDSGQRAVYGTSEKFQKDENWSEYILFFEYFHGDKGSGLGASHQTGWTGLIGKILQQLGTYASAESSDDMQTTIRFTIDRDASDIES